MRRPLIDGLVVAAAQMLAITAHAQDALMSVPAIPFKTSSDGVEPIRLIVGLALSGLVLALVLWNLNRRFGRGLPKSTQASQPLQVIQRLVVDSKSSLLVVTFRGQEMLLAKSEQGISLISDHVTNNTPGSGATQ